MNIIREITKLLMFTLIWAAPFIYAYLTGNHNFLFLLIGSLIVTIGIFSHYETLEEYERKQKN